MDCYIDFLVFRSILHGNPTAFGARRERRMMMRKHKYRLPSGIHIDILRSRPHITIRTHGPSKLNLEKHFLQDISPFFTLHMYSLS